MLALLDPSALSPALLSSVKSLIKQPKSEFTLVDPVVSVVILSMCLFLLLFWTVTRYSV